MSKQDLGDMTKRQNILIFIKSYKRHEIVECYDYKRTEGIQHREDILL